MSGFLRPEAARFLRRWWEVLAALAVVALGVWIALRPGPIVQGFGFVLMLGGALAAIPALRRARFAPAGEGAGVVQVDEGRVVYMGPYSGGAVSLRELQALSLRVDHLGQRAWVLTEPGQMLVVPVDALGAEALFDAFTSLEGLRPQRLSAALRTVQEGTTMVWRRDAPAPHHALTR